MRTLFFMLIAWSCFGQATYDSTTNTIRLPISQARNTEYWAQKGYSASFGVPLLENRIYILENKIDLLEIVNKNSLLQAEQYRAMVKSNAELNYKLQQDIASLKEDRDGWKLKAKTRGTIIWAGGAILGLFAFTQLTK